MNNTSPPTDTRSTPERRDAGWLRGCAQRLMEVAAFLRSRRDGDHMEADAAIDVDRAARALLEIAAQPRSAPEPSENYEARYYELLYAVGNKYEGETRHQTALRYIRQAESSSGDAGQSETKSANQVPPCPDCCSTRTAEALGEFRMWDECRECGHRWNNRPLPPNGAPKHG